MLDYEVRNCERYRRFMSLVYVNHGRGARFRDICGDMMRHSDELIEFDSSSALLMGETNIQGALLAIDRFKRRCDAVADMRYAVVAYPADGRNAEDLLAAANKRLASAKVLEAGAVVCSSAA